MISSRAAILAAALSLLPSTAFAHASERGHVLLLPTGYYLVGGALAVAASFLILAFVQPSTLDRAASWRLALARMPLRGETVIGLLSFAFFVLLVLAGFFGSPDPLHNPLPTVIWTLLWVGLTLLHGIFGNLWSWINPWHAPYRFVTGLVGHASFARMPSWLGHWPAVALLLAFTWLELIDLAPEDPRRLALAAGGYWLVTFLGCLIFGHEAWMRRCEFLSVFFGMVSRFAAFDVADGRLSLCLPGGRLARAEPLGISGMVFLLTALGSVSFDGLSKTFTWLAAIGVNPLEFPGRSLVVEANTIGLMGTIGALIAVYVAAIWLGERLVGSSAFLTAAGTLVWSIVPIALAYHFSHYLTALLVDSQYALIALSDPFSRGWNLLGLTGREVHAGIVMGHDGAWAIWNAQAAAIVGGHVLAVLVAHMLALRLHSDPRQAMLSQLPLAILMVGYTLFGLWLLSTPSIG